VTHQVGDPLASDLGGPHDLVLCRLMTPAARAADAVAMLARVRQALRPGGILAFIHIHGLGRPNAQLMRSSAAAVQLFLQLGCSGDELAPGDVLDQVQAAGFSRAHARSLRAVAALDLYIAHAI
jgi:hypothetical protein